jgi:hypothetical protein
VVAAAHAVADAVLLESKSGPVKDAVENVSGEMTSVMG